MDTSVRGSEENDPNSDGSKPQRIYLLHSESPFCEGSVAGSVRRTN